MTRQWFQSCPCGHQWLFHDIGEPDADDELCCVEGCDQRACPGRNLVSTSENVAPVPAGNKRRGQV